MDTFIKDVRYAFRTLGRAPVLTGLAILCLALGIGANATMFSVVHSTLVQPLPFPDPTARGSLVDAARRGRRAHDRRRTRFPRLDARSDRLEALVAVQACEPDADRRRAIRSGSRAPR